MSKSMNYNFATLHHHREQKPIMSLAFAQPTTAGSGSFDPLPCRILILRPAETGSVLRDDLVRHGYKVALAPANLLGEELGSLAAPELAIFDSVVATADLGPLIARLKANWPFTPLILLAHGDSLHSATQALRFGADQVLPNSVDVSALCEVIERMVDQQRLHRRQLAEKRLSYKCLDPFIGASDGVRRLAELAQSAASNDCPALIVGERGTGKASLANWLHQHGRRAAEPFLELNYAGVAREMLLSATGHGNTSRVNGKPAGLLRLAQRGTVFINAIQNANTQTQLIIMRLFTNRDNAALSYPLHKADIRLLAASEESAPHLVRAKRLRADLYSAIGSLVLPIPPLRQRLEDLPFLADRILRDLASELGSRDFDLTRSALQALQTYSWPGNTRELRIVLERSVLIAGTTLLTAKHLQLNPRADPAPQPLQPRTLETVERAYIEQILEQEGGRVEAAAKILGVPRSSLYYKIKKFQIARSSVRRAS
jgi:DNA-binding NtrC family response regulator